MAKQRQINRKSTEKTAKPRQANRKPTKKTAKKSAKKKLAKKAAAREVFHAINARSRSVRNQI